MASSTSITDTTAIIKFGRRRFDVQSEEEEEVSCLCKDCMDTVLMSLRAVMVVQYAYECVAYLQLTVDYCPICVSFRLFYVRQKFLEIYYTCRLNTFCTVSQKDQLRLRS